jgi:hypothetical protein
VNLVNCSSAWLGRCYLQDQGSCSACSGFAGTAAAEAAVNAFLQQDWQQLSLSEQDFSFCRHVAPSIAHFAETLALGDAKSC